MYQENEVRAGITLLNGRKPDWADSYHRGSLDMSTGVGCVLGQVFGSFQAGMEALHITLAESEHYGFSIPRAEVARLGLKPGMWISRSTHPEFYGLYDQLDETWLALTDRGQ